MTATLIPAPGWHGAAWPGPDYGAYGWPWPGLIWLGVVLLFWAGLIALLVWAVRSSAAPRRAPDTAMEVLRRRLASGEISQEEYEHIRRVLES
jgi:uncharacterized membrane protein